jgi:hypothetical protein
VSRHLLAKQFLELLPKVCNLPLMEEEWTHKPLHFMQAIWPHLQTGVFLILLLHGTNTCSSPLLLPASRQ